MRKKNRLIKRAFVIFLLSAGMFCCMGGIPAASAEIIVTDEQGLIDAINSSETMIVVANDITVTKPRQITRELTIKSSAGATLLWGGPARGTLFTVVGSNAHLTLEDITLDGNGAYVSLVTVSGATFTMQDGAVLKNLLSDGRNRAVTVGKHGDPDVGGTFHMKGGLITGVSLDAVVLVASGTVYMSGSASVSDNDGYGFALLGSTLNMEDKATISHNTAVRTGVGVLAGEGSVINMGLKEGDAPSISHNTSTIYYGGGIYLVDGELNMAFDASISHNTAETMVGGVGLNRSILTMQGNAKISGNTTRLGAGGGIYASRSEVHLSDAASVFGNSVTADDGKGGGIYLQNDLSLVTMSGTSAVYGNNAAYGGGLYLNVETKLEMSGGRISANVAGTEGGGVLSHGAVTLSGGVVDGNRTVLGHGGGFYLAEAGNAVISAASVITNNSAPNGHGGGIFTESAGEYGNLSTDRGTRFSGNRASIAYTPPENALEKYPNLLFASPSIGDHPLNNYDINFSGTQVLTFHVEYVSNGGTGHYVQGGITPSYTEMLLPLEATGISRAGYRFAGWNSEPDGSGHSYAPGDTVTVYQPWTLYAQWTPPFPLFWCIFLSVLIFIFLVILMVLCCGEPRYCYCCKE